VKISLYLLSGSGIFQGSKEYIPTRQPLAQCKGWLRANLPMAEIVAVDSTTTASAYAREDDSAAAVASGEAAEFYGLRVVARNIEDLRHNYTRFFVIGRAGTRPTGNDKHRSCAQ
jgi:chorismate mutase/prephenate dehydratase